MLQQLVADLRNRIGVGLEALIGGKRVGVPCQLGIALAVT